MPGRPGSTPEYRYGFNGMESDDEVSGEGNSYTTEYRHYDPRLGRWKSLDPLMSMFPDMSPYVAFANNPIVFTDPYGLAPVNGDDGDPPAEGLPENPEEGKPYKANDGRTFSWFEEGGWATSTEEAEVVGENKSVGKYLPTTMEEKINQISSYIDSDNIKRNSQRVDQFRHQERDFIEYSGGLEDFLEESSDVLTVSGFLAGASEHSLSQKEIIKALESKTVLIKQGGKTYKWKFSFKGNNAKEFANASKALVKNRPIVKVFRGIKVAGKVIGGLGLVVTAVEIYQEGLNAENSTDFIMGAVGLVPGGGWVISGLYFGGKFIYKNWDPEGAKNLYERASGGRPVASCFVAGTKIHMADGSLKNIEQIEKGDQIIAVDTDSMLVKYDRVLELPKRLRKYQLIKMTLSNNSITGMSNTHPVWVYGKGWSVYDSINGNDEYLFNVSKLEMGDTVAYYSRKDNKLQKLLITSLEETNEHVVMYNIDNVKSTNTFFANGVLVHNRAINLRTLNSLLNSENASENCEECRVIELLRKYRLIGVEFW